MPTPSGSIATDVLNCIKELSTRKDGFHFDDIHQLVEEARKAGRPALPEKERFSLKVEVLAYWNDLIRSGVLAFGSEDSWSTSRFHLGAAGKKTLEALGRDPANAEGYLAHLRSCATLDAVAESYVREALHTYQAGCHKATAVMIGTGAEGIILDLRDAVVARLVASGKKASKELQGWKIKLVCDELSDLLEQHQKAMPAALSGAFETYWAGFTSHVRAIRNKSGHPNSVDPVSHESVHAALLMFPEFAQLVVALKGWASSYSF
jgi:hypothetical protein